MHRENKNINTNITSIPPIKAATTNISDLLKKGEGAKAGLSLVDTNDNQLKEDNLVTYYCSLCGANALMTDTMLESMPRRKTDESIIVLVSKIYFKSFLRRDRLMVVKRDMNKYEKQYRFVCQECGVFIAYQSMDYEENDTINELKRRSNKIFSQNKKKILYILIDAVVADPRQSSLYIEMDKIKENQEKQMSFVRLKKTEVDEYGKEKEKIVYL